MGSCISSVSGRQTLAPCSRSPLDCNLIEFTVEVQLFSRLCHRYRSVLVLLLTLETIGFQDIFTMRGQQTGKQAHKMPIVAVERKC